MIGMVLGARTFYVFIYNWEYFSRNTTTGKTVRINMEAMIRDLETFTGNKYIESE